MIYIKKKVKYLLQRYAIFFNIAKKTEIFKKNNI